MKMGYARVSSSGQHLDVQRTALTDAGCEKIYAEKVSGVGERAELQAALQFLREGNTLVIYKLDSLGRNMKDLLALVEQLYASTMAFFFLLVIVSVLGQHPFFDHWQVQGSPDEHP